MAIEYKALTFILATIGIIWVSRSSLRSAQYHGFYRFFAWETILILFLMNMNFWFVAPFSLHQIFAWLFLIISLMLIYEGVRLLRSRGQLDQARKDPGLVGIEKTTELVTTGIYKYIRHPFYSSLLFLGWGILLKKITMTGIILTGIITILLLITARMEEQENLRFFGSGYQEYMRGTKMFIPFIL